MSDHESRRRVLVRASEYEGQRDVVIDAAPLSSAWVGRAEKRTIVQDWRKLFRQPTEIRDLTLDCRVSKELFAALSAQTQLERLRIKWGPYSDLDALSGMTRLRELILGGATAVTDLSPLQHLTQLTDLTIEDARRVRDFSPLAHLTGLRSLSVGCGVNGARWDADSIGFVSNLTDLREFLWVPRVADRDFTPLLALTAAEEIALAPTKGMSPGMAELEWHLPGVRAYAQRVSEQRIPIISSQGEIAIMARDVTGKVVFEAPLPDDVVEILEPTYQRGFRGLVSGTTFRTFSRTPRTRIEVFRSHVEGPVEDDSFRLPDGERLLGTYAFAGPIEGPLLVWDGPAPGGSTGEPLPDLFHGNIDARKREPQASSVTIDVRDAPVLSPEDFWQVLEEMNGRTGTLACAQAEIRLARKPHDFVLRWARTLGTYALALAPVIRDLRERGVVHPDHELQAFGVVLGRGEQVYHRVISDPTSYDPRWIKVFGNDAIWIGKHALHRQRVEIGEVVTDFTPWLDAIIDDFSTSATVGMLEGEGSPEDRWLSLTCARGWVRIDGQVRERLILVDIAGDADWWDVATAGFVALGGELVAGPELADHLVGEPHSVNSVLTVRRRSTLPDDEYIARYSV